MNLKTKTPIYKTQTIKLSELPEVQELDDTYVFLAVGKNGTKKISYKSMYDFIKMSILKELNDTIEKISSWFNNAKIELINYKKNNDKFIEQETKQLKNDVFTKFNTSINTLEKKVNTDFLNLKNEFNKTVTAISHYNIPFFNRCVNEIKQSVEKIKKQTQTKNIETTKTLKIIEDTLIGLKNELSNKYKQLNIVNIDNFKYIDQLSAHFKQLSNNINIDIINFNSTTLSIQNINDKFEKQISSMYDDISTLQNDLSNLDIKLYGLTIEEYDDKNNVNITNILEGDISKINTKISTLIV